MTGGCRICISLAQHGDDLILKRMKRRHLAADVLALVAAVRDVRPDCAFGADLIAGFPPEDGAAHQATLDLIDAAGLTWLHVSPIRRAKARRRRRMLQVDGCIIRRPCGEHVKRPVAVSRITLPLLLVRMMRC